MTLPSDKNSEEVMEVARWWAAHPYEGRKTIRYDAHIMAKELVRLSAPSSTRRSAYCESCGYTESHDPNCPKPKDDVAALIYRLENLQDDGGEGDAWSQEEIDLMLTALRAPVSATLPKEPTEEIIDAMVDGYTAYYQQKESGKMIAIGENMKNVYLALVAHLRASDERTEKR